MRRPGGRAAPGRGGGRWRAAKWGLFLLVGLIVVQPLGDIANAYLTPHDGCRVIAIVDGDTVRLHCPVGGYRTGRLLAFDTPELRAECMSEFLKAQAATLYLRWMLWRGGHISARLEGTDRHGRALTLLLVDGQGVARPMVEAGLARWYDGGPRAGWCD